MNSLKKSPRYQNLNYLKWLSENGVCWICGSHDVQISHFMGTRQHVLGKGMGTKTHDFLCAPLCQEHHAQYEARSGSFKAPAPFDGWAADIYHDEQGFFMAATWLAIALQSGDWELRRRK